MDFDQLQSTIQDKFLNGMMLKYQINCTIRRVRPATLPVYNNDIN